MLTINLVWDADALAAPQSFRNQVQAAAAILDAAIFNPITINISVGYGEYDLGGPSYTSLTSDISLGGVNSSIQVSYPLLQAALAKAAASPADVQAVASLPATAALNGQTSFYISLAQAKALGVLPANGPEIDGFAGFPTSFTGTVLIGAAITELAHAMGLTNDGFSLSLFEYTSQGNHLLTAGTAATPAYFSIDGGKTELATYDVGFDSTLFNSKANDPLSVPVNGSTTLTALDLTEIGAIGYDTTSPPSVPSPGIVTTAAGSNTVVVNVRNATVTENTAVAAATLISSVSAPLGDTVAVYAFYDVGGDGGHLLANGIVEPDGQWVYALSTQLSVLQYVGGASPGRETIEVYGLDTATTSYYQVGTLTATTVAPSPPKVVNNANGTSSRYVYAPSTTVTETINTYSGANATGSLVSTIVDNADGTSALYAFNPTPTVKQTASQYAGTNADGSPAGAQISDVVDNVDGTSIIYSYNPTSTVTQTTAKFSATNPDGSAAGAQISDVVDNTDGTSLIYSYNPSATVLQTTAKFAGTNPVDGSPTGAQISDVVDNTDGTSIIYAYNPTSTVSLTATKYSATNADGSPSGSAVSVVFDYTAGGSAVTVYGSGGTPSTTTYSGPDGTGSVTSQSASNATFAAIDASTIAGTINVTGADQVVDPGPGDATIQFLAGAAGDTVTLYPASIDHLLNFDPATDTLDVAKLFAAAGVTAPTTATGLGAYLTVTNQGSDAILNFDQTGQANASPVAILQGLATSITTTQQVLISNH